MEQAICKRMATVRFWDGYAKWYKLWMEHNNYHYRIIETLVSMIEPGWKVLDIGAGNGILSLPLCAVGCDVTALEPSIGMRNLLYEELFKRGIDWLTLDERRWEDIPCFELGNYDLIMACNSLHLTEMGFRSAVEKIFRAKPRYAFVITEIDSAQPKVNLEYKDYKMSFTKCYETENSFVYNTIGEIFEHWSYKKGRFLFPEEEMDIKTRLIFEDDHISMKDTAIVGMYWWKRIDNERKVLKWTI